MIGTGVLGFIWLTATAVWRSTRRRPGTSDEARTLIWTIAAIIIAACFLAIAQPASAHTQDEYDQWVLEWSEQVLEDGALTRSALLELHDFNDRHPCQAAYCAPKLAIAPTESKVAYSAGVEQWRGLVEAYFPGEVERALRVMHCESRGDPNAKNPSSSARGLFQIMASIWAPHFGVTYDALYDPDTNVRLAAQIRDIQGWSAWVCK